MKISKWENGSFVRQTIPMMEFNVTPIRFLSIPFVVVAALLVGQVPVVSQQMVQVPNSDNWKTIGIHEESTELVAECRVGLNNLAKNMDKLKDAEPLVVGRANALCNRLIWHSKTLMQYGEPAAIEYYLRATDVSNKIRLIGQRDAARYQRQSKAYMDKTRKKRQKQITRIQQLMADQQWLAAEKVYFELQGDIDLYVMYLRQRDRQILVEPLISIYQRLPAGLKKMRVESTREKVKALFEKQAYNTKELVSTAREYLDQTRKWSTDPASPDKVAELFAEWNTIHAKLQRATALDCISSSAALELEKFSDWSPKGEFLGNKTCQKLKTELLPLIASVIETDLTRAEPVAIEKKYLGYCKLISELKNTIDEKSRQTLVNALDAVESNSAPLKNKIAAYRKATDDILYWREKLASQKKHPLEAVAPEILRAIKGTGGSSFSGSQKKAVPNLMAGLHEILPTLRKTAIQRSTKVPVLSTHSAKSPHSFLKQQCWAIVRTPPRLQVQLNLLRQDLIASTYSPLDFRAFEALRSAESGQWVEVGGSITNLRVASLTAELATLPDKTPQAYVPLGSAVKQLQMNQALIQVEVVPAWVRHTHFVYMTK